MNRETEDTGTPDQPAKSPFCNTSGSPTTPPVGPPSNFERGEGSSAVGRAPVTDPIMSDESKDKTISSGEPSQQFHNNSPSSVPLALITRHMTTSVPISLQFHNNSQSAAPIPPPLYSLFDVYSIFEQSLHYLAKLETALEGGKINVNTFVLKLQEVNDCEDSPLSMNYSPASIKYAARAMMKETITYFTQKRDAMNVCDQSSRKRWMKFNTLITELVRKRASM